MRIDIIVKALIVKSLLLYPQIANAWTVNEQVIELPQELEHSAMPLESKVLSDLGEREYPRNPSIVSPLPKIMDNPVFEKTQAKLTNEEETLADFRRAMEHLSHGEGEIAQKLLLGNLQQSPNHHPSRIELATLYIKQNELILAEELLMDGLKVDENHPDYLRLMAIVHDKREEPEKALSLLIKVKDSRKHDKNYIALLGHLYQETGHFTLARQQYYRLLQEEPSNPLWLLGVSIALDSEGQSAAALEGYERLTKQGNVDPSVLEYIHTRIKALKG